MPLTASKLAIASLQLVPFGIAPLLPHCALAGETGPASGTLNGHCLAGSMCRCGMCK